MERTVYSPEHERHRAIVRSFLAEEVVPEYGAMEASGNLPRHLWRRAGELGLLGVCVPPELGGLAGSTFKHSAIFTEEAQRAGLALGGVRVHTDICMPYFLAYADSEQRERWLPRLAAGEAVAALAMSEPAAGSDLKAISTAAVRDGADYVVNGSKTFITNGAGADLVILAVKTKPEAGRDGISLLAVEASTPGFERGRKLEKLGLRAQDLSELFFTDMRVPAANLLGRENHGFEYLTHNLAQERLSIGLNSQAAAVAALEGAAREAAAIESTTARRRAKFELAACSAEVSAGQALADQALESHVRGQLGPADAARVKLFCTELQGRVVETCARLRGPASGSRASAIGRAVADARVSRIYGGSSEVMKVVIGREMGL